MIGINKFQINLLYYLSQKIIYTFSDFFESTGYIKHAPCNSFVSDIDHSVRFIGSTTNVFKQYLINSTLIPPEGYFLIQKCLRTRNTSTLFNDNIFPEWSSYFIAIGIMAPADNLKKLIIDTINFLIKLDINVDRIKINISSKDTDLLKYVKKIQKKIKFLVDIDGVDDLNYYRHKYGINNIYGRNFNISIKNPNSHEFKDIGNIILIERNSLPIAVEMGMGVSTLISRIFGLNNSIESSSISKIIPFGLGFMSKFSDTLSVSVIMLREKIKPGSRDKSRLLRTNLIALSYFRFKLNISLEEINMYSVKYEKEEFGEITDIGNIIVIFLKNYEKYI